MNVLSQRTNAFPQYCGDFTSQYTSALVSPTTSIDFNVPTWFGGYNITPINTSQ